MPDDDPTFEKERERLSEEIASGFEVLLTSVNVLNRKVEEVLGMTREYESIASLWSTFHQLMRSHGTDADTSVTEEEADLAASGLPGTGSHIVSNKQSKSNT